ncbi:hypothetical protein [Rhodopseudomonas sp. AAP120]|uniref:hypothetical protein n=1 Tax=Rhodopseudomonas sp. AAP120 TaxID=1523430 RepID=UPI000B0B10E2|nr:hypothetical protein [Rhodopseudomonas sp. AAP120]
MRFPLRDQRRWHRIFAIIPREIEGELVWLEWIERRTVGIRFSLGFFAEDYEYRTITR